MFKQLTFLKDDQLDREPIADQLTKLILNSDKVFDNEKSLSIALDSPWGTGKSTFLEMWKNKLMEDGSIGQLKVVTYNAWYDDDFDTPLIPIIYELSELFADTEQKKNLLKVSTLLAAQIGKGMLTKALEHIIGIDLESLADSVRNNTGVEISEVIKSLSANKENDYFKEYKNYRSIKEDFKTQLSKAAKEQKIVFLIDELDRCRPTYAIETLETIKHLFDTPNIIFIVAMDMEQLKHSISTIYGANMDSYGYLRRFFDFNIRIPSPSVEKYLRYLDDTNLLIDDRTITEITNIFAGLNLTLRDMNVVFTSFKIVLITKLANVKEHRRTSIYAAYIYLTAIKHKQPEEYKLLLSGNYYLEDDPSLEDKALYRLLPATSYKFSEAAIALVHIMSEKSAQMEISTLRINGKYDDFSKTLLVDTNVDESLTVANYIENKLEMVGER
ncbi:KAP family P-loop domain protein [compost metagenome]